MLILPEKRPVSNEAGGSGVMWRAQPMGLDFRSHCILPGSRDPLSSHENSHLQPELARGQERSDGLKALVVSLSDSQIQLISGHSSKKSLEIYQHLSLESVQKAYQDVVKTIRV